MDVLNRENQAIQLALTATVLLRLGTTDDHLRYVKAGMRPWLLTAGIVVAILAVTRGLEALRTGNTDDDPDSDHAVQDDDAHGGGNLPWLLLLPFLAVVFVGPAPLGAFSAARQTPRVSPPPADAANFPPLPDLVDGAHELTLIDFTDRALYDTDRQMAGQPIRLTGFVTPAPGAGHDTDLLLTRFILSCCAADGIPIQVRITGLPGPVPPPDTWLAVEGTWQPDAEPDRADAETATLVATTIRQIPQPANPYEG
jgi:uncharacterized repeat protein (TIGR03943 family)